MPKTLKGTAGCLSSQHLEMVNHSHANRAGSCRRDGNIRICRAELGRAAASVAALDAAAPFIRRSTRGGQVYEWTISTKGQAPSIVVEMTVVVVSRSGWWLDQNEAPASAPDMVIWGESASSQKPRP